MSRRDRALSFRLGDLLMPEACERLDTDALIDFAEGRLDAAERADLSSHARTCTACAERLADLELFGGLIARGVRIPSEQRAFERAEPELRRRLRLAPRAAGQRRSRRRLFLWLLPAVAAVSLLALLVWPRGPVLVTDLESFPFSAPPAVRGIGPHEAWKRAGEAWERGEMKQAAIVLRQAVRLQPDDAGLRLYLGLALLRSGDADGAIDALREADRLAGDAPSEQTRWVLAGALEQAGEFEEACALLESVIEIGGSRAEAARSTVTSHCD